MPIKALRALASRYAHGQVGWMHRLPAAGAGRKADRYDYIFISRKPRPVGGELHFQPAIINSMM